MASFRDATIKSKLTWTSGLITSIAVTLAATGFVGYYIVSFRDSLVRNLSVQAETIALNSVAPLRFDDPRAAGDTLSALRADRNIMSAAIYASSGLLFASYAGPGQSPPSPQTASLTAEWTRFDGRTLDLHHPIRSEGEHLGAVHLVYGLDALYGDVARFVVIAIGVLVTSVLLALAAAARIQRSVSEPVARLAAAATTVSVEKNYGIRVEPTGNRDELGTLIDAFNDMLTQIHVRDSALEAAKAQVQGLNEELEQRVALRTAELEATNKELEAFTYSVSHDLRAPLRRIDGFAQMLMEDYLSDLPAEAQHYLNRMRDGTRQMGLLVDDLLSFARLGRQEPRLEVAGLSSIVDRVAGVIQRDINGREIEWKIEPLPFVECDPALIEVVFTNLLSNAVKYSRPRQQAVIHVGALKDNGHPTIFVRDNGVGFSMKYADKLFGVFQRLHRVEDFEGTGVGLATVQRIVHKHGGSIWAEAELDKGACFYFTLTAKPPAASSGPPGKDVL